MPLQKQLESGKKGNAGKSQKTGNQGCDCVDGKDQTGKAGDQIQQPQADKAGQGVDADLPDKAQRRHAKPKETVNQYDGNQKPQEFFHVLPPHKILMPGNTELGEKRDGDEMKYRFKIHFFSRVSPETADGMMRNEQVNICSYIDYAQTVPVYPDLNQSPGFVLGSGEKTTTRYGLEPKIGPVFLNFFPAYFLVS